MYLQFGETPTRIQIMEYMKKCLNFLAKESILHFVELRNFKCRKYAHILVMDIWINHNVGINRKSL